MTLAGLGIAKCRIRVCKIPVDNGIIGESQLDQRQKCGHRVAMLAKLVLGESQLETEFGLEFKNREKI